MQVFVKNVVLSYLEKCRFQQILFVEDSKNMEDSYFILHVGLYRLFLYGYFRIIKKSTLCLTCYDINFDDHFEQTDEYCKKFSSKKYLLNKNLKKINKKLKKTQVVGASINEIGDLKLKFSNGYELDVLITYLVKDSLYYKIYDLNKEILNAYYSEDHILIK